MDNKLLQRLRLFIKSENITIKAFAESIGVSEGTLNNMFSRGTNPSADVLIKISNVYPKLSLRWLLKNEGEMLSGNGYSTKKKPTKNEELGKADQHEESLTDNKPTLNYRLIPLMNMDVAGGSTNHQYDTPQYVEKYVPFIDAKEGDIACPVTNDSMSPVYPPGTFVQIRKIELWREYIEYGQVYVVDLVDGRRLIKLIKKAKSKERLLLVSFNERYDDNEIPFDMIYSMWLVISKYERVVM